MVPTDHSVVLYVFCSEEKAAQRVAGKDEERQSQYFNGVRSIDHTPSKSILNMNIQNVGSGSIDPLPTEVSKKIRIASGQMVRSDHKNENALRKNR